MNILNKVRTIVFCGSISTTVYAHESTQSSPEFIVLPGVFRAPETGFGGGLGLFILSPATESPVASKGNSVKLGFIYTEKKQFVVRGVSEQFINHHRDHIIVSGNAQKYPDSFFGVGNNTRTEDEEKYTSYEWDAQFRFLHEFSEALYLGGQGIISHERIADLKVDGLLDKRRDQNNQLISGTNEMSIIGIGAVGRWDTRNDLQDPDFGNFLELGYLERRKSYGSDHEFTSMNLDCRGFIPIALTKRPARLAWQAVAISHDGEPPFQALAPLGGRDLLRGYFLGRYRDRKLLAGQTELRFPISELWGVVGYVGTGNVARNWQNLTTKTFKPAWGLGGRYRISKNQKVNMRLDLAWGRETPSPSVYLSLAEAF